MTQAFSCCIILCLSLLYFAQNVVCYKRFSSNTASSRRTKEHILTNKMADIMEIEEEDSSSDTQLNKTDADLGKTHGYEGDFKLGDVVKINSDIRLWHVKAYNKEGFVAKGFQGKIQGFDLYGRKYNSLCSAITPIRVEFSPDGPGIPQGMFDKKFVGHFSSAELELVSRDDVFADMTISKSQE